MNYNFMIYIIYYSTLIDLTCQRQSECQSLLNLPDLVFHFLKNRIIIF